MTPAVNQPIEEVIALAMVLLLRVVTWAIIPLAWVVFLLWVAL